MSFLFKRPEFLDQAEQYLVSPLIVPSGDTREIQAFSGIRFSQWLSSQLEADFSTDPLWLQCDPILLGSWARQELCLKSDLDVLFCGPEDKVFELVQRYQELGIKLRYRVPAEKLDWTKGVELFDVLALMNARPLTANSAKKLYEQQRLIWKRIPQISKQVLKTLQSERMQRSRLFDSLTNYLEPHLKSGPGGLRDLEQGLQVYNLFGAKIANSDYAIRILNYYKSYWLTIRHKLHLNGSGDQYSAGMQHEIYKWLGFNSHLEAMRSFQRGLSRVHFYSDWLLEASVIANKTKPKVDNSPKIEKAADLVLALLKSPSLITQKRVRESMDHLVDGLTTSQKNSFRKKGLEILSDIKLTDEQIVAFFRSRIVDKIFPEFSRLVGHVQHDHYHRFTVDAHILQARREVRRIYENPKILGKMSFLVKKFKREDWSVLALLSLYHDIGKGLEKDHSIAGVEIFKKESNFLKNKKINKSVEHLILNHLELSKAAFKLNPNSMSTWVYLNKKGIEGEQLKRLAAFTCVDIRATNPEAWNEWKSSLLASLVDKMIEPETSKSLQLQKDFEKNKIKIKVENIDSFLIENIDQAILLKDIKCCQKSSDESFKIFKLNNKTWLRFYTPTDRRGVLLDLILKVSGSGVGVTHASVNTISGFGVYNWLQISNVVYDAKKTEVKIKNQSVTSMQNIPSVKFKKIEWIDFSNGRGNLLFKAIEQPYVLANAIQALTAAGADIHLARVHTWGRQIEDVFEIVIEKEPQEFLKALREKLFCIE